MVNVEDGNPFGEIFTCLPKSGAEAVKKTCCSNAQSRRFSGIESQNWTMVDVDDFTGEKGKGSFSQFERNNSEIQKTFGLLLGVRYGDQKYFVGVQEGGKGSISALMDEKIVKL